MIDSRDQLLLQAIQQGLPLSSRPYAQLSHELGLSEHEVLERLSRLQQKGLIKRLGVIVKHRALGYTANAMVVWNIPDDQVQALGKQISAFEFVSLCYRRPRQGEGWPYNLFCMIHGKSRDSVHRKIELLEQRCMTSCFPREILFSVRCFKQRGAVYDVPGEALADG